jgi:hypothetical protein
MRPIKRFPHLLHEQHIVVSIAGVAAAASICRPGVFPVDVYRIEAIVVDKGQDVVNELRPVLRARNDVVEDRLCVGVVVVEGSALRGVKSGRSVDVSDTTWIMKEGFNPSVRTPIETPTTSALFFCLRSVI